MDTSQPGLPEQPSDSSMSASQSSPSRSQQQRIRFPQSSLSSPSSEVGPSASSSPIGAGLRSLEASSGRHTNRLSQSQASTSAAAVEPYADQRRRVRSDAYRPSSAYSRTQYVSNTGTTRSSDSARRIVSYNPETYIRPARAGTASIGSSPLAAGALLPPEDDAQGELHYDPSASCRC